MDYTLTTLNKDLPNLPSVQAVDSDECSEHSTQPNEEAKTFINSRKKWINLNTVSDQRWRPFTQTPGFLLAVILASLGLIIFLQLALARSNRDSGILFASNVNDLALSSSFWYLYLPTIIALTLSFTWTWIDLDTKRLQPFLQLSKSGGARGDDSVLLHYPFDFVAFVPFKALRRRHWPVLSASVSVVLIFWGLTPLQAGIFATKTVTKTDHLTTTSSTAYMSIEQQNSLLTGSYVQHVYNILWLNETLPPFMSRDYLLAPFRIVDETGTLQTTESWTGRTRLYSVDVACQPAIRNLFNYISYNGCTFDGGMNPPSGIRPNQYATSYVGYWYQESMDMYLVGACPVSANRTFFAQWSRGQMNTSYGMEPIEATSLFCESSYYQQDVIATVVPPKMAVANVVPTGPKKPLSPDLFNITDFEWGFNAGTQEFQNRGPFPTFEWPDSSERLSYLDLAWYDDYVPGMAAFAIAAYQRQAPDYMNATLLADSYQAAYRLLFSRRLVDILSNDLNPETQTMGMRTYQTQSIVLVPVFVYIVEALLMVTLLAAVVLLYLSFVTSSNLRSDPADIASIMALAADKADLSGIGFALLPTAQTWTSDEQGCISITTGSDPVPVTPVKPSDSVLPRELSGLFGILFLLMQVVVIVVLVCAFVRCREENGLPVPSSSLFVNQLVENYVPMVVAAFYEPVWVVVNRLICMLQPFEQLRRAVVGRALRAGHMSLALICIMALLANVLSVAFSSLLFEDTAAVVVSANFSRPYKFPINGSTLGNASFVDNQRVYDQFYVAMSNLSAGTPLPPWTDESFFYIPFGGFNSTNDSRNLYQAVTQTVRASLECTGLSTTKQEDHVPYEIDHDDGAAPGSIKFSSTISFDDGTTCDIVTSNMRVVGLPLGDNIAMETTEFLGACNNTIVSGWVRSQNATYQWTWNSAEQITGAVGSLGPVETSWIICKPKIFAGQRIVTVDHNGYVQSSSTVDESIDNIEELFQPNSSDFLMHIHALLGSSDVFFAPTWHNDSYPSDFFNYLMVTVKNNSDILDPSLPPPTMNETIPAFTALYANLFAIILGTNIPKVLRPERDGAVVSGSMISSEVRIFFSSSMFTLSIVILSLTHNTTAENSLLLHYPFDFIATVPYRALKNRHWPVFSVSLVIVVTFWAVTPLQSGIFATENRTLSSTVPMLSSTSYLPIGKQTNLTSVYAQHVANIAWLNETLPSYMTRDAILSPFAPAEHSDFEKNETWFGSTRLFSVDVTCEQAVFIDTDFGGVYNGTNGCSYEAPPLIAPDSNDSTKYLDTIYVGYQDENGFAEYYLSSACPQNQSHTFFVRMASVSGRTIRNHTLEYATALPEQGNSTALYCEPRYYSQLGNATVSAGGQEVLAFVPTGDKEPLPQGMFDIDAFEWNMNSAQTQDYDARGDFPTTAWPDQMSHFLDTHLDLNYFPKMCAFALACYQRPLEDYLDPVILARSYEAAYRLLFARQMADILQPNYKGAVQVAGTRTFEAQGVVLVPTFTYIVTALLGINIIFASWLLYFAVTRSLNLASNPSTIASMMSQVADDIHIQKLFSALDRSSEDELAQKLGSASGTTFLALQLICFVILAVLQNWAARENGIPLPSEHTVVRQLVENYVPMAIDIAFLISKMLSKDIVQVGAFALIAGTQAHMIMNTPTPYGLKSLQTSPLNGEGYNFPCQSGTRTDAFDADGASNPMVVGQDNDLKFTGSAVHGGGSCQLSVTYDYPPPADKTKWKVIHSFIGSCPASAAANLATTTTDADGRPSGPQCTSDDQTECLKDFKWQLPTGMKNGNATLAWTWFNKIGNREMYMNCAPISISGGSDDDSVFNSLPELFVANIPGECTTGPTEGVIGFADPGTAVTYGEAVMSGANGACPGGSSGSASGSASSSSASAEPTASSAPSATYSAPQATGTPAATTSAPAAGAANSSTPQTTMATTTSVVVVSSSYPTASVSSSSGTNSTSSGSCGTGYTYCDTPTLTVCSPDGTQFGICGEDNCALYQDVSEGTHCSGGLVSKRSIRAHRHVARGHKHIY
ncbi:hypothetical protein MBLNU459_g3224t1 [Dothideomycetes sp. NU459]